MTFLVKRPMWMRVGFGVGERFLLRERLRDLSRDFPRSTDERGFLVSAVARSELRLSLDFGRSLDSFKDESLFTELRLSDLRFLSRRSPPDDDELELDDDDEVEELDELDEELLSDELEWENIEHEKKIKKSPRFPLGTSALFLLRQIKNCETVKFSL